MGYTVTLQEFGFETGYLHTKAVSVCSKCGALVFCGDSQTLESHDDWHDMIENT